MLPLKPSKVQLSYAVHIPTNSMVIVGRDRDVLIRFNLTSEGLVVETEIQVRIKTG